MRPCKRVQVERFLIFLTRRVHPRTHTDLRAGLLSDVNAATILTVEAVPTSPPIAPPIKPQTAEQESPRHEAAANDLQSVVTVVRPPKPHVEPPSRHIEPKKSRGKALAFAGAGVLLVVLVVVAVAGIFAFNWFRTKPDDSSATGKNNTAVKANNGSTGTSGANATEFGRYWLEVLPNALMAEPKQVAGASPLASGQAFKFHFLIGQEWVSLYRRARGGKSAQLRF